MSGETSACACVVAGSKHASPSAAAKTELFTTVVTFISFSFLPRIFVFEFIVLLSICTQFYSFSRFASMQRASFVGKAEVNPLIAETRPLRCPQSHVPLEFQHY